MEEPPSYLKLILITHRRNELLATIRSRCAPVKFSPLPFDEMRALAAEVLGSSASSSDAEALARIADGRPGQLAAALDEGGAQRRSEMARLMMQFRKFGFVALFRTASDLQQGFDAGRGAAAGGHETGERIMSALTAWLRDAAICKTIPPELAARYLVYGDQKTGLAEFAAELPLEAIVRSSQCIQEYLPLTQRQMDRSFILESLLMQLGRAMRPA
jgi:DNA polymerase III gamma/tau subunit